MENSEETQLNKRTKFSNTLSTPLQLLENYPYAQQIGWALQEIEFLFDNNLVDGERTDELRISDASFEKMLAFHRRQRED